MTDSFFTKAKCDRCGSNLVVRTMSWFTEETICIKCSAKEDKVKAALRAKGIKDAMEGCGYVPNPDEVQA